MNIFIAIIISFLAGIAGGLLTNSAISEQKRRQLFNAYTKGKEQGKKVYLGFTDILVCLFMAAIAGFGILGIWLLVGSTIKFILKHASNYYGILYNNYGHWPMIISLITFLIVLVWAMHNRFTKYER